MQNAKAHETTVVVSMPDDLKVALDAEAARKDVSVSDVVLEAVRQRLNVAAPPQADDDDRKAAFARLRSFAGVGVAAVGPQGDADIMRRIQEIRED
ncbi:MAG: hypothetical protein PW843_04290 [Azospirillaceae bacterium]|nr:hypothetical protein [Azospirillaceae bacterium]